MAFLSEQTQHHKDHSHTAWKTVAEWQIQTNPFARKLLGCVYSGQLQICMNQSGGQHRQQLIFPLGMSCSGPWAQAAPTCGVLSQQTAGPEAPGDSQHTPFLGSFRKPPSEARNILIWHHVIPGGNHRLWLNPQVPLPLKDLLFLPTEVKCSVF